MNSKLSKSISTGVIIVLVMACALPAAAGKFAPGKERHGQGFGRKIHSPALGIWRDGQMNQKLELTKEQVKDLRNLDFFHRAKCLELKAEVDRYHLEMEKAFTDDTVDHKVVSQLAKKIADTKGKLFVQDIESRLALGKILNADQIEKLRMSEMRPHKKGPGKDKKYHSGRCHIERSDADRPAEN